MYVPHVKWKVQHEVILVSINIIWVNDTSESVNAPTGRISLFRVHRAWYKLYPRDCRPHTVPDYCSVNCSLELPGMHIMFRMIMHAPQLIHWYMTKNERYCVKPVFKCTVFDENVSLWFKFRRRSLISTVQLTTQHWQILWLNNAEEETRHNPH